MACRITPKNLRQHNNSVKKIPVMLQHDGDYKGYDIIIHTNRALLYHNTLLYVNQTNVYFERMCFFHANL